MSVCLYFQLHQPERLGQYHVFDINSSHEYFDKERNKELCEDIANKCYLPANKVLLKLIEETGRKFKVAFSISGVLLEQLELYAPEVIESFKELSKTGCVEFLAETYYHSLSYIYSREEFMEQLTLHEKKIEQLFGQKPKVFRNTELIMNNEMAAFIENRGYKGVLAEGADHLLGWRSPNFLYKTVCNQNMGLLLRNYKLSDDVAFRFSNKDWIEYPLNAEKYAAWINNINNNGEIVNIFMDYETFGEHHSVKSGIMEFIGSFPKYVIENGNQFMTPSQIVESYSVRGEVDVHEFVSWADAERDISAWISNPMQNNCLQELYGIEKAVKESGDEQILKDWRFLTTSDHFYYMSTKWFSDGVIHGHFNPHGSPYEVFIVYMNVLNDLILRLGHGGTEVKISENPSKNVMKKRQK
ncbi:MAG: glycoside hydrolase family 57 protein [Nanoarchaeota archaeon]